ncbi:thioredoxin family protein [Natronolimnohabitans innermongolicus]|nr:thioredoxin family protein [Natronolimnohabitans innermongolicus]
MDGAPRPTRLADGDELATFRERNEVALVEFYTSGCGKCQAMEPVLGNVARETEVPIGLLNPGDDIELVERFDINSVPTLILFADGAEVTRRADGFLGADDVVAMLGAVPSDIDVDVDCQ